MKRRGPLIILEGAFFVGGLLLRPRAPLNRSARPSFGGAWRPALRPPRRAFWVGGAPRGGVYTRAAPAMSNLAIRIISPCYPFVAGATNRQARAQDFFLVLSAHSGPSCARVGIPPTPRARLQLRMFSPGGREKRFIDPVGNVLRLRTSAFSQDTTPCGG